MKEESSQGAKRRLNQTETGQQLPKGIDIKVGSKNLNKTENTLDKVVDILNDTLDELKEINYKQNTIKSIMIFWLVLTIIGLVLTSLSGMR